MSLWKKIGLGLLAAFVMVIVGLLALIFIPGAWKVLLIFVAVVGVIVFGFFVWLENSHPRDEAKRRADEDARWRRPGDDY
ncbi:hypothetical protein [Nonomuraea typhae]|uniref:hypothetical protein n=1 Tax=Nonomuraea typhae TaxID=2603600 RepID=UPI0012FAC702|nr:hypothetical protein [Nonomuraea typhae]